MWFIVLYGPPTRSTSNDRRGIGDECFNYRNQLTNSQIGKLRRKRVLSASLWQFSFQ